MRLVTYRSGEGAARAGIATESGVVDLEEGARAIGLEAPASVVALLGQGEAGLATARDVAAAASAGQVATIPEANVEIYRRLGFDLVGRSDLPGGLPSFEMRRDPQ